jgi:hypothetical protein
MRGFYTIATAHSEELPSARLLSSSGQKEHMLFSGQEKKL